MGRTILVLEDNLITLGVVDAILRQAGHEVLKATDEAAALGHVKNHFGPIELLIADATMAGRMNGRMVRSLQESRPEAGLAVSVAKSYASEAYREAGNRGIARGNQGFLSRLYHISD